MIKVAVADDQPLMREGLKYLIEQDSEIDVVGCAANGFEAYEICKKHRPDVVLMDLSMPECDGIEGTRLIKGEFPGIKVVILTSFKNAGDIVQAMDEGADSYILKDIDPEKLIISIKSVAKGLKVIHEDVFKNYADCIRGYCEQGLKRSEYKLTERELEIIRLIVHGNSNKEIAANLQVTENVVRNSISGILSRLNLQDRTQLAVFSLKNRIV
jgi:DNA-binding NarL/FixJ family response regulator